MLHVTRLRFQAALLFSGVACLYAAFSPFAIAHMGYTQESMQACRQLLAPERPRVPPAFGVDWPRNGSTEVLAQCGFVALGRALGGSEWEERALALQPVLATAGLVTVVFAWASRLAGSRRKAFWLALAAGFGTMLWPYAYIGLETTQSLFLLLAGYLAIETPAEPSWKRTLAFAVCAAVAVSAKSGGVALVPALLFLAVVLLRKHPVRLAAAIAIMAAVFMTNNHFRALSWERFGGGRSWSLMWQAHDPLSSVTSAIALLTSPNKGLLVYAPLALLGLALLPRAFRRDRALAAFVFLSLAGPLALVSQVRPWSDETWGPRYLHSALAPLLLCVASALRGPTVSRFLLAVVFTAAGAGVFVSFLGSMFNYGALHSVAVRSVPLSLQSLQGDLTWNHVAFNARLWGVWRRSREPGISSAEYLPAPDGWNYDNAGRKPEWSPVDLREVAISQAFLLRPTNDAPGRLIRRACTVLLLAGLLLLFTAARAAALFDRSAAEAPMESPGSPAPAAGPLPGERAPSRPPSRKTPVEIYDGLVRDMGFDPEHPGWFPELRDLHRHSRQTRLQVVPDFFYTSVFSPADLPAEVWNGTFPHCGTFDLEAQRAFLRETPAFRAELQALPVDPDTADDRVFHWNNEQFSHADAALYYSLIRRFRPKRIIEVGSGHSTKLALRAVRDNRVGSILCIEPHPPSWLQPIPGMIEIQPVPVQGADDSVFLSLEPSDILFIDGSHISKTGSDVNHLFLRILPRLPAGVIVQIHDICLPYEYPRNWSEDVLCYWNEQYVLAALLANGVKYEILVGVYFVQRNDLAALRPFVPELPGVFPGGGSLWMSHANCRPSPSLVRVSAACGRSVAQRSRRSGCRAGRAAAGPSAQTLELAQNPVQAGGLGLRRSGRNPRYGLSCREQLFADRVHRGGVVLEGAVGHAEGAGGMHASLADVLADRLELRPVPDRPDAALSREGSETLPDGHVAAHLGGPRGREVQRRPRIVAVHGGQRRSGRGDRRRSGAEHGQRGGRRGRRSVGGRGGDRVGFGGRRRRSRARASVWRPSGRTAAATRSRG